MKAKITKTYLGSTGNNYKTETKSDGTVVITTTETATFHVDFPSGFVNSLNRRFITVMPPKLLWGAKTVNNVYIPPSLPIVSTTKTKVADNMYIMHCSFIHRDPWHDQAVIYVNDPKRKYKKYEYKACEDGFDITFTDYFPAFDYGGWIVGTVVNGNLESWKGDTVDETTLTNYFQQAFPDQVSIATDLAQQCVNIYYDIVLGSVPSDLVYYRNNERFTTNTNTYVTDYDMFDIVSYVIEQNGLAQPLVFGSENTRSSVDGDYIVYVTTTSYKDNNINRNVSYTRYTRYKILKDSEPWYYYAEFMVEY